MLAARLCVSQVPVESIQVAFSGHVLRNTCLPGIRTVRYDCPDRIRCLRVFYDGHFMRPLASLVAIGDAMPKAYASVGLTITIRKNCL
jgi:hypothetical protein